MAKLVYDRTHHLPEPQVHLLTVYLRAHLRLRDGQHLLHQPRLHLLAVQLRAHLLLRLRPAKTQNQFGGLAGV